MLNFLPSDLTFSSNSLVNNLEVGVEFDFVVSKSLDDHPNRM